VSLLNLAFAGSFFICLLVVLNLLAFLCYQLLIEDFSLQNGKMVLTLCRPHRVLRWQANEPFVTLSSTGTPPLENLPKGCSYRAKALTGRDLHLIHPEGKVGPWDTSIGFCRVGFLSALVHTGYLRLPSIFWLLLWFAAGAAFARQLLGRMIIICLLLALVSTLLLQLWYRWMTRWSPLALKRDRFLRENLASPGLERVDSGPQRAVSMRQVSDLFTFFQSFIRDRSMYYICSNLVQPLTKRSQSSYAELAGPSRVSWFISHYWGTPFRETVDAIRHHAKQQGAVDWQSTTYWICTFANNQWQVKAELGNGDWRESSFYKALCSDSCQGTVMVLDEKALPLTRAWCLFELLRTQRILKGPDAPSTFHGLLLCTASGVLGNGQGGIDIAMAVANCLAELDLRDAEATDKDDEVMIRSLVEQMPGGFRAMNAFMRTSIRDSLLTAHANFETDFEQLLRILADIGRWQFLRTLCSCFLKCFGRNLLQKVLE